MSRLHTALFLTAAPLVLLGAALPVQRPVEKLYTVDVDPVAFGLVQVQVDEDVNAKAPSDFANMSGLVAAAADRCVNRAGSGATFKSFTDLGYQVKWTRAATSTDPVPWVAAPFEGVPNGVDTPLLTAIKVVDWRTYTVKDPTTKLDTNAARVSLVFVTRARGGGEILTQLVTGTTHEGLNGENVDTSPTTGPMSDWFLRSDGRKVNELLPKDRAVLFQRAVEDAVCMHFYPFSPHTIYDGVAVLADKASKPGFELAKAGDYDGAIAAFEKVVAADPTDDGAIYNIGAVWYARGDYDKARTYVERALAIKKTGLYNQMIAVMDFRDKMEKSFSVK
jgi:hypothetical protein